MEHQIELEDSGMAAWIDTGDGATKISVIARFLRFFRASARQRSASRELEDLSDRLLRDVGIERAQIPALAKARKTRSGDELSARREVRAVKRFLSPGP